MPIGGTLPGRCGLINVDCVTVTLKEGEILLNGVLESGAVLAHDCGGKLACASCCVVVDAGHENLSAPSEDELDMLDRAGVAQAGARLACQASGTGAVVVSVPRTAAPARENLLPVILTADAARFLAAQLAKHPAATGMRLAVAPAGCSGLRYRVDPVDAPAEDDAVYECEGMKIVVDPLSLPFVQGTTVGLAREGLALRLRFDNPNARQSCGCGESFSA